MNLPERLNEDEQNSLDRRKISIEIDGVETARSVESDARQYLIGELYDGTEYAVDDYTLSHSDSLTVDTESTDIGILSGPTITIESLTVGDAL